MCRLAKRKGQCKAQMMSEVQRHPGDMILDHAMPNASHEEREAARENLRRLARFLIRVHERLAREKEQVAIRSNGEGAVQSECPEPSV